MERFTKFAQFAGISIFALSLFWAFGGEAWAQAKTTQYFHQQWDTSNADPNPVAPPNSIVLSSNSQQQLQLSEPGINNGQPFVIQPGGQGPMGPQGNPGRDGQNGLPGPAGICQPGQSYAEKVTGYNPATGEYTHQVTAGCR